MRSFRYNREKSQSAPFPDFLMYNEYLLQPTAVQVENFLLLLGSDADTFKSFTDSAFGANRCCVVDSGKGGVSGVMLPAFRADFDIASFFCFHFLSPILSASALRRNFSLKPKSV